MMSAEKQLDQWLAARGYTRAQIHQHQIPKWAGLCPDDKAAVLQALARAPLTGPLSAPTSAQLAQELNAAGVAAGVDLDPVKHFR